MKASGGPHESKAPVVEFVFPVGCKIMLDAATRLLSLINQVDHCTRHVRLDFQEGEDGAMGYLNRMGFFEHLSPRVEVIPSRPLISTVQLYRGTNQGIVEFARINQRHRDKRLPGRLADALLRDSRERPDAQALSDAAWTVFAELIDNVYVHSDTPVDGFAALQMYKSPQGKRVVVAVSDSGYGIFETLKPVLIQQHSPLAQLSDIDLLVEIFRQGISRHGPDRGCGLQGAAGKAKKYNAELDVRLPHLRACLLPRTTGYEAAVAYCYTDLPLIWGTHICFSFRID